jgi:hypothetical protein
MPMHRPTRIPQALVLASVLLFAGVGCHDSSPGISVNIAAQLRDSAGGSVDLAQSYESDWDRVCVLGPYSRNADARTALGFDWDAEGKSAISRNDGIALLLFVRAKQVVAYAEHPRNLGDFAHLSGQCFPRAQARFYQRQPSKQGAAAGLYPKGRP